MWDYVCPRCKKEVNKKSHVCVHCGENYGAALRVLPRVLKDKKILEDYVHKHVFPKVSPSRREYLTRFFTEFLRDDFESNNFNAWSGTQIDVGCALTTQNTTKHHGSYAAEATTNGAAAAQSTYCYHTLASSKAELYVRFYVYIKSHNLAVTNDRFYFIRIMATATDVVNVGWRYITDGVKWQMISYSGAVQGNTNSANGLCSTGQWYCVEAYWLEDAVAGIARVYVNGILLLERTAIDSNDFGDATAVRMGITSTANTVIADVIFDCCVIADAYIGPEISVAKRRLLMGVGL
jgi:hypothetical protein